MSLLSLIITIILAFAPVANASTSAELIDEISSLSQDEVEDLVLTGTTAEQEVASSLQNVFEEIKRRNPRLERGQNFNLLFPGDIVVLPNGNRYSVAKGDWMWKIAQRFFRNEVVRSTNGPSVTAPTANWNSPVHEQSTKNPIFDLAYTALQDSTLRLQTRAMASSLDSTFTVEAFDFNEILPYIITAPQDSTQQAPTTELEGIIETLLVAGESHFPARSVHRKGSGIGKFLLVVAIFMLIMLVVTGLVYLKGKPMLKLYDQPDSYYRKHGPSARGHTRFSKFMLGVWRGLQEKKTK